jgi:tetratricopeptide (TPR) repeat protein
MAQVSYNPSTVASKDSRVAATTISPEVSQWLRQYYDLTQTEQAPAQPVRFVKLAYEPEGDYTAPIERLAANAEGETSLDEIIRRSPYNLLLGTTGSGKTYQLQNLWRRQAYRMLDQVEQASSQTSPDNASTKNSANPSWLALYLNLGQLTGLMPDLEKVGRSPNFFQTLLERAAGQPFPEDLLTTFTPLLLLDNLELLDPALAPLFFYRLNQWLGQQAPGARILIGCRHLSFSLYHPWFKAEQNWQVYVLPGFDWPQTRAALAGQLEDSTLAEIEQTGLTGLFTHPALHNLSQPLAIVAKGGEAGAEVSGDAPVSAFVQLLRDFLNRTFGTRPELARSLAQTSTLLPEEAVNGAPLVVENSPLAIEAVNPASHYARQRRANRESSPFEQASQAGLVEKHPVTGRWRPVNPALDRLLAAWFCLHLEPETLANTLGRTLATATADDPHLGDFLRLLYRLNSPEQRPALFSALLKPAPIPARLDLLLKLGQADPAFGQAWRDWLAAPAAELGEHHFKQQVLQLSAGLSDLSKDQPRPWLAEPALLNLAEQRPAEPGLHLALGQAQEQLGKPAQALFSYRRAYQLAEMPALDSALNVARLLLQQGRPAQAAEPLVEINQKLVESQAEVANQLALVKRAQKDYAAACQYARQAVSLNRLPAYRLNLALSLYDKGEAAPAEQELVNLTAEQPDFADAFCDLGRIQLARGAHDLAFVNLRRAVELSATTARYLYSLGRSLLAGERPEEAYSYLRAAWEQSADNAEYGAMFGLVAFKLRRIEEARAALQSVLKLAGDSEAETYSRAGVLVYLAASEYATGNYLAAAEVLALALKEDHANPRLQILAGRVWEAAGQPGLALAAYREAANLLKTASHEDSAAGIPTEVMAACQLGLARCYRLAEQLAEADTYLQAAKLLQPDEPETLYEAGQLAMACQNYVQAAGWFSAGLETLTVEGRKSHACVPLAKVESQLPDLSPQPLALNTLSGRGWLELFSSENQLAFDLSRQYAAALSALHQDAKAQEILHRQLKRLAMDQTGSLLVNVRRAALYYQLGLSLLATNQAEQALNCLSLAAGGAPDNVEYRLGLARALLANGQADRALAELEQARALVPAGSTLFAEIARLQLEARAGSLDATILLNSLNLYLRALEAAPEKAEYLYQAALLAYHLRYQNQAGQLIARLLSAISYQPSAISSQPPADQVMGLKAQLLAACNLERGGQLEAALAEIKQALNAVEVDRLSATSNQPPATQSSIYNRQSTIVNLQSSIALVAARLQRKLGRLTQMEQTLATLELPAGPLNLQAAIWGERGWLATARQLYPQAVENYRQAVESLRQFLDAGNQPELDALYEEASLFDGESRRQLLLADHTLAYASALQQVQQVSEALAQLDEAVKLNPRLAAAHILRGKLWQGQGQTQQALDALTQAAKLESSPALQYELGRLYLKLNRAEEAIEALKQAAANPEIGSQSEYYASLGQAYQLEGKNGLARAAYTRALQLDPHDPKLHQAVARCYLEEGEPLAAVQPLQEAVVREPANSSYRLELAQLYEELGWLQDAASEYEQATRLSQTNSRAWLWSGQLLVKIGRNELALEALHQALSLDDKLPEAHYEVGRLYLKAYQDSLREQDKLPPDLQGMFGEVYAEAGVIKPAVG